MASVYEVETALVNLAASAVYPNGTINPSVANIPIVVRPGWPEPNDLDKDMAHGKARVSIFPISGMERNTTSYQREWLTHSIKPATLVFNVLNKTITLSGTASTPATCMIIVNQVPYTYEVQSADSLTSIAANIAAVIPNATATGITITVNNAYSLVARVNSTGKSVMPLKSQERVFQVTVWAPRVPTNPQPQLRDIIAHAIEVKFAAVQRILMNDGFYATLSYKGSTEQDMLQKASIYRRDLRYGVDYTTTQQQIDYTITYPFANIEFN